MSVDVSVEAEHRDSDGQGDRVMAMEQVELIVIGAGPAGLAAAATAASRGVRVTLLDEQPEAGGQIYRAIGSASDARRAVLGRDYASGEVLLHALSDEAVKHVPGATVWEVTREREVCYSVNGEARRLRAERIIVATGALERPMPMPGWTLPGVMNAGAAQILLKQSGLLAAEPVVLAGCGPLLYLLATQLLKAGVKPAAIVDTTLACNRRAALRHLPAALAGHRLLRKGLTLLQTIRRAGVPWHREATALAARGDGRVEALDFTAGGKRNSIPCNTLLLHIGVVPNVQLSRSLGIEHRWHPLQRCWHPVVDDTGATEIEGLWIAGDGAGIAGAEAAASAGRLAAMAALAGLDCTAPFRAEERQAEQAHWRRHARVRPFLDALYAPAGAFLSPADEVIVCRCEEVSVRQLRDFVALGCLGPNQAKSYGRCGMGPCQGRYCGLSVSEVIAAARGLPVEEVGYFRLRAPLKPITLGELASLADTEDATHAG